MSNNRQKINQMGLEIPSILLPKSANLRNWPVIACDQYTQDRDYWERVKTAVSGSPSTLNLIFPEVFLTDPDPSKRIGGIHSSMTKYLNEGVFDEPKQGFIYIERDTPYQKKRRGLIAAIDLERYDWHPEERPLIRCTEGTVEDRLPPRMNIRRGAPLELPHVLLLIDDDKDSLLPALGERLKNTPPVYSTRLMMDSGNVTGWFLNEETDLSFIAEQLEELYNRSDKRYGEGYATYSVPQQAGTLAKNGDRHHFLFAVGDGNHSLAAAKGIWEEYKAAHGITAPKETSHPCRYALVEIENIYDPAIQFEPIHRVVFDIGYEEIISLLSQLPDFSCRDVKDADELIKLSKNPVTANCFGIISEGRHALIETSAVGISTACLQPILDKFAEEKKLEIDYIHDDEEVLRLAVGSRKAAGILLPPIQKAGLFETVARTGPLPRKSFSMGHSCEKRFYLECRQLF